jgi:hypothetical protein
MVAKLEKTELREARKTWEFSKILEKRFN